MVSKERRFILGFVIVLQVLALIVPLVLKGNPYIESASELLYILFILGSILLVVSLFWGLKKSRHLIGLHEIDKPNREKYDWDKIVKRTRILYISVMLLSLTGLLLIQLPLFNNDDGVVIAVIISFLPLVFYSNPRRKDTFEKG